MNYAATLKEEYAKRCMVTSDINLLLPTLHKYAVRCGRIAELGVRGGNSTIALAFSDPGYLISCDWDPRVLEIGLWDFITSQGVVFDLAVMNSLEIILPAVELLFIDTTHTYEHLLAELNRHQEKVMKYIAIHDTETHREIDQYGQSPALEQAICDFLQNNKHWRICEVITINNGPTILERI